MSTETSEPIGGDKYRWKIPEIDPLRQLPLCQHYDLYIAIFEDLTNAWILHKPTSLVPEAEANGLMIWATSRGYDNANQN